jgi:CelD/BcsL family acetyltransferase involved in cellulose biosynthesis
VAFPATRRALEAELASVIRRCAGIPAAVDHARRIEAAVADAPIVYPYLDLPDRPDAVLLGLGPSHRACLRRRGRRFADAGGRFEVVEPSAITAPDVRDHLDLHRARWGEASVALGAATAAYHEDLALALAGAGILRLFFARHGGARVASLACFDAGRRRECFNAGRSPAADALRAGKLLLLHAIGDAVERGLAVFDLGYGGFAYKLELTRQSRTVKSFLLGRGALPSPDDLFAGYERVAGG